MYRILSTCSLVLVLTSLIVQQALPTNAQTAGPTPVPSLAPTRTGLRVTVSTTYALDFNVLSSTDQSAFTLGALNLITVAFAAVNSSYTTGFLIERAIPGGIGETRVTNNITTFSFIFESNTVDLQVVVDAVDYMIANPATVLTNPDRRTQNAFYSFRTGGVVTTTPGPTLPPTRQTRSPTQSMQPTDSASASPTSSTTTHSPTRAPSVSGAFVVVTTVYALDYNTLSASEQSVFAHSATSFMTTSFLNEDDRYTQSYLFLNAVPGGLGNTAVTNNQTTFSFVFRPSTVDLDVVSSVVSSMIEGPNIIPLSPPEQSIDAYYTIRNPIGSPTAVPSLFPTSFPSAAPTTTFPTAMPTVAPTTQPTRRPTFLPSVSPTRIPTTQPTLSPSAHPTAHPFTVQPTTMTPTAAPTTSPIPPSTETPTNTPSTVPSAAAINITAAPTTSPTQEQPLIDEASTEASGSGSELFVILGTVIGVSALLISLLIAAIMSNRRRTPEETVTFLSPLFDGEPELWSQNPTHFYPQGDGWNNLAAERSVSPGLDEIPAAIAHLFATDEIRHHSATLRRPASAPLN